MKRFITSLIFFAFLYAIPYTLYPSHVFAIEDPLSLPNNKVGIHILFTAELEDAAKLVNANGDWGYVTIPIQSGDKDIEKWQTFMNEAKRLHVIPLIRLATEGDYFNTKVWRRPSEADINDFANFLNSLDWPTKNRYIIVFNEVNRGDEWGGDVDSLSYAQILSYAGEYFTALNPDFFVIAGGMDNGAPQAPPEYMDQYVFLRQMVAAVPNVFEKISGISSHSYPNPGFSQPPSSTSTKSIRSFVYERDLIESLSGKRLPVFITETGWTNEVIADGQRAEYYKTAFDTVWNDDGIVAVTPFILHANNDAFRKFSFLTPNGEETMQYKQVRDMKKVAGQPSLIKDSAKLSIRSLTEYPTMNFKGEKKTKNPDVSSRQVLEDSFNWIMKLD